MKQFKDLKVGDIVMNLDYNIEYKITRIETYENSTLVSGWIRLYYDGGCFTVKEHKYCYDCGNIYFPKFITPKENLNEFREVYKIGIEKGVRDFKDSVKTLFEI
jgi:hypothetical protein